MSPLSKMQHSRDQWKYKAKQRGERERYQRKQNARLKAERDQATTALKATQARLRQLEAHRHGPRHCAQGRRDPRGSPTLFRGTHWLSGCLSCPHSSGCGPRHQESAVPTNPHQLGHPALHRAPRLGPSPAGLAPEPGALYQRPSLDDRSQHWPGLGEDFSRFGHRRPSSSARQRCPLSASRPLHRGLGGRVLDGRIDCRRPRSSHRADGPPGGLS